MAIYAYWYLLGLVLLGLEMATGTFYLLVVAVGMAVGGTAALLGADLTWQLALCALTIVAGTILLRRWKKSQSRAGDGSSADFDIGRPVRVLAWREDGSARVAYRGAEWDAEAESADMPREGTLYIKAVRGASLVLTHQKPQ